MQVPVGTCACRPVPALQHLYCTCKCQMQVLAGFLMDTPPGTCDLPGPVVILNVYFPLTENVIEFVVK